jgi:hypothetical protein
MNFTDTELRTWDRWRLRVGCDKRKQLFAQVATLIEKPQTAIPASSPFRVVRFRRAGPLPRAKALHPHGDTGTRSGNIRDSDTVKPGRDPRPAATRARRATAGTEPWFC